MDSIKRLYDKNSPEYEDLGNLRLGFNEYSDNSEEEWKKMNGLRIKKPINPKNIGNMKERLQNSLVRVPQGSQDHSIYLKNQLDNGPVDIKVDAGNAVFKNYRSGIIETATCGQDAFHNVQAVGYETDPVSKLEYVIIQNSWKNWGQDGKAKISFDTKNLGPQGVCGIYNQ